LSFALSGPRDISVVAVKTEFSWGITQHALDRVYPSEKRRRPPIHQEGQSRSGESRRAARLTSEEGQRFRAAND
jgi:hypothetical protein